MCHERRAWKTFPHCGKRDGTWRQLVTVEEDVDLMVNPALPEHLGSFQGGFIYRCRWAITGVADARMANNLEISMR